MKNKIHVSQADIKRLIREAIDGVFSTDSPEGEHYKEISKSYVRPDSDRRLKDGWELKDFGTTGEPWKDNDSAIWDTDEKRDRFARDEFGEEEKESQMYDENPEGTENQWYDEQGYDPEEIEEPYEMYENRGRKQIKLNETQLREFISYSVARILNEGYGRDITLKNGEYDGYEGSKYGYDEIVIEPELDKYLVELGDNDEGDAFIRALDRYIPNGVKVKVKYNYNKGMKGDGYSTPDDPDECEMLGWEIVDEDKIENRRLKDMLRQMVEEYMDNDFDIEDEVSWRSPLYEEEDSNTGDSFAERCFKHSEEQPIDRKKGHAFGPAHDIKPEVPTDASWDEFVKRKMKEKAEEDERDRSGDWSWMRSKPSKGTMVHIPGKKED